MNTQAQFKTTGINGNFDDFEKYRLKEIAIQLKKTFTIKIFAFERNSL